MVIELKARHLDSGTLHQALYYASSLARLTGDELCAKLEPGLKELGDAGMLSARVRQLLDSEADGGGREIAVALVGFGVTAGLERMQEFLGRFKMSVDVVSFEVFELAGGPRLLIREVTEEHADAPSRLGPERSVEAIRRRAAAEKVLEPFAFARRLVADAGGRLLVQDGRLIVTRGDRARTNLPALEVDLRADGTWVDWGRGWRRTLASVRAAYLLEDGSTTAFVDVGSGEAASRPRTLPGVYPSAAAATAAAAAYLAGAGTSRDTVNLVAGFLPAANVLQPLRIVGGEDRIPGGLPPLIVRRLKHSIGRNAATTTIAATPAIAAPATVTRSPSPGSPAAPTPSGGGGPRAPVHLDVVRRVARLHPGRARQLRRPERLGVPRPAGRGPAGRGPAVGLQLQPR